jgi:hypothetical protein
VQTRLKNRKKQIVRRTMQINRCPKCGRDHFADVGKMVVSHAKKP